MTTKESTHMLQYIMYNKWKGRRGAFGQEGDNSRGRGGRAEGTKEESLIGLSEAPPEHAQV